MRNISTGVIESNDSMQQLNLVNELRRMRKYERDLFTGTLNKLRSK